MMHPSDKQWWRAHSADYVLGLLSNSERLVFERIMPTEPELQEFVVDWREKLQPMSDAIPPIKPPDHILPALISNIPVAANNDLASQGHSATQDKSSAQYNSWSLEDDQASTGSAMVTTAPNIATTTDSESAANDLDTLLENQSSSRSIKQAANADQLDDQLKNNVNTDAHAAVLADGTAFMRMVERKQKGTDAWRSYAGLATAVGLLVATLGWMSFSKLSADNVEPVYDGISIVQSSDAKALWVVDSSADDKKLRVTAVAPPALEEGQAFELWMIRPDDGGVVSMGLLPDKINTSVQFSAQRFNAEAESFGVSVESTKGSPESIPTGPVLYQGKIQTLLD